jgi:hypothetical protein
MDHVGTEPSMKEVCVWRWSSMELIGAAEFICQEQLFAERGCGHTSGCGYAGFS